MKIAVIAGASSSLGYEYAVQISKHFKNIKEIWLIDNKVDKIGEIEKVIHNKKIKRISLNLSKDESYVTYKEMLEKNNARIKILINTAVYVGDRGFEKSSYKRQANIVNINCKAMVAITKISVPYMYFNSYILNVGSIAGYIPMPNFSTYSAANSMIMSFSKALNRELKNRGIRVTAVVLSNVAIKFLSMENRNVIFEEADVLQGAEKIVKKSLRDAVLMRKNISVYEIGDKVMIFLSKFIPYKVLVKYYYL